jgi:type I restriction enzyme S subunit
MVPELRFPGFKGSWNQFLLANLGVDGRATIKAGPFGSALKKEFYIAKGYKIYGQEQVISGDPFYGDYYIDQEKYKKLQSCSVERGDLLISLVGTIGKVLVIPEGAEPGIINPRLLRISLRGFNSLMQRVVQFRTLPDSAFCIQGIFLDGYST